MKKIISILMLLIISLSVFSGCAGSVSTDLKNEYVESTSSNATAYWMDGTPFTPVLRFVTVADTHLMDVYYAETDKRVQNLFSDAYAYARTQEYSVLDAVVFSGDVCETGNEAQYKRLMDAWTKNILPETSFLCLQAGHELIDGDFEIHKQYTGNDLGMHMVINGFHFITISNMRGKLDDDGKIILGPNGQPLYYTEEPSPECDTDWIKEQLEIAAADGDKPIFTFHHHPQLDTILYSQSEAPYWGGEHEQEFFGIFKQYQQIVDFTGHLHSPVSHPRSIMQKDFTSLHAGALYYTNCTSDYLVDTPAWNSAKNETYTSKISYSDARNASASAFNIVEVDAEGRIRILPYDLANREFFTEIGTGKENVQLIRYIEDVFDKSTWLYTADKEESADVPTWGNASIRNITFGTETGRDVGDLGNVTDKVRQTIKFTFDSAIDKDGIEVYKLQIYDKTAQEYVNIRHGYVYNGQYVAWVKDYDYQFIDSFYYLNKHFSSFDVETNGVKLIDGHQYQIRIMAVDTYHKESQNLVKDFTYFI